MEGAAGWALLGLQGQEVESPEASGHVGFEGGGASHLKKYIFTVHISTKHSVSGQKSDAESVSASHWSRMLFLLLLGPASLQGSLARPARALRLAGFFCGGREVKGSIPTHGGQRAEAWGWSPLG